MLLCARKLSAVTPQVAEYGCGVLSSRFPPCLLAVFCRPRRAFSIESTVRAATGFLAHELIIEWTPGPAHGEGLNYLSQLGYPSRAESHRNTPICRPSGMESPSSRVAPEYPYRLLFPVLPVRTEPLPPFLRCSPFREDFFCRLRFGWPSVYVAKDFLGPPSRPNFLSRQEGCLRARALFPARSHCPRSPPPGGP